MSNPQIIGLIVAGLASHLTAPGTTVMNNARYHRGSRTGTASD